MTCRLEQFLVGPSTEASKTSMTATTGHRHGTSAAPSPCLSRFWRRAQFVVAYLTPAAGRASTRSWPPARGLDATGIDASPKAIQSAKRKATDRGVAAHFVVRDALALADLNEQFDTVLDSGLFHVFDDERRAQYVASLAAVVRPGGRLLLVCFSDRQPGDWGPRRVRQAELRDAFASGWVIDSIEPVRFDTNLEPPTAEAWLARITSAAP